MLSALLLSVSIALPQATPEGTEPPKARPMVLHLENGAVLRVRAREREDGWEFQKGGDWVALPASAVVRARSERELLDEAEKLQRALPRNDAVRRVAYADWLVSEGLTVEALKQLDRVLEADPDQADAVALFARARLPLALAPVPADASGLDAWFAACATLPPSAREVAVRRLAEAQEVSGLRTALGRELVVRSAARRGFATLVLRRLFPGSEAESLISRAVLDASADVREGAALALRAFANPTVIEPAVRALGSKNAEVRSNAAEALANMDYREAVEPLYNHLVALQSGGGSTGAPRVHIFNGTQRAYVQDFDVEIAQNASIADPIINILLEGSVLDVAVVGVTEYQVANERAGVRRALAKLTGADPGSTTVAWQRWWKEHGDEWRAASEPPRTPTSPAGQG